MLKSEREQEIFNILKEKNGFTTVKQLCDMLYVSESSIRRDLCAMEDKGLIKRTYGGAELVTNLSHMMEFNKRYHRNISEKNEIAKKALSLIEENSVIFLDQSSSAFYLAAMLPNKSSITVITNNVEIMKLLSETNINLISSGGYLSRENRSCLIGKDAEYIFENTYADLVFFSCKALSDDGVVYDCSREEVLTRAAMLKNAKKRVFLCDSSKLETTAIYKQCTLDEVDFIICDKDIGESYKKKFCALKSL